jgi:hypothetical protein
VTVGRVRRRRLPGLFAGITADPRRNLRDLEIVIADAEGNEVTAIEVISVVTEKPVLDLVVEEAATPARERTR